MHFEPMMHAFHPVQILLMYFAILLKIISLYCEKLVIVPHKKYHQC